jgi:thiosulfate/3-mercaptopyruvate sulfurtransferase
MHNAPLISAQELQALLNSGQPPVILDASFDLADPVAGEQAFARGHLPGAQYVHLERDLSGAKTGTNGRHPLPERRQWAQTVGRWGVTPATPVVVYDHQGAMFAARAWWLLRWLGHPQVAVLDSGASGWQEGGGELTTVIRAPTPAEAYPDRPPLVGTVDADAVRARLGRTPVIDARAPERFRGDVEPLDPVAGHIPGARNRFFRHNLADDGRFKAPDVLRAEFADLLGQAIPAEVVHQCGSGATACHNLLAMAWAGLGDSLLYPGSWSEWCADPSRPVARG